MTMPLTGIGPEENRMDAMRAGEHGGVNAKPFHRFRAGERALVEQRLTELPAELAALDDKH